MVWMFLGHTNFDGLNSLRGCTSFPPWSQPAAAATRLFSDEPPTKLAAKYYSFSYYTRRAPPRLAASRTGRLSTAAPCPLDPPPPPHPLALLANHPNPAVAQFPRTGFSHLADRPLLARAIHALALRLALPLSAFHRNTLLAFYFRHRSPAAALHLFDAMPDRTPSSWYTAVSGCVRSGRDSAAFELLREMRDHDVPLSGFALASLVTACERWGEEGGAFGAAIHALTHEAGLMGNVYIGTALLHLYGSRGLVLDARRLFWEMPERNVVSWTAFMVALSSNGYLEEALEAYLQMRRDGVTCNANAFATVASLCGSLENEVAGLQVASHIVVSGLQTHVSVANSLITMSGNMKECAASVFCYFQICVVVDCQGLMQQLSAA